MSPRQLALMLGIHRHLVDLALSQGDTRRIKSVAKLAMATYRLDTLGDGLRAGLQLEAHCGNYLCRHAWPVDLT